VNPLSINLFPLELTSMKKSQLINDVIVRSGMAKSEVEANKIFVLTFAEYFADLNLRQWDSDVPTEVCQKFLHNLGRAQGISVRYLIKDLDSMVKKS
jgi:hypothetical protein